MRTRILLLFACLLLGCSDNPDAPTEGDKSPPRDVNLTLVGEWYNGPCWSVFADGNYAYIANGVALDVLDVTNLASPRRVGRFLTKDVISDIAISNERAFIANWSNGLRVIDVSSPSSPVEIGSFDASEPFKSDRTSAIQVEGNYAYLFNGELGLQILDVSDPSNPVRVGRYINPSYPYVGDGCVSGHYAYGAYETNGVNTIDISTPNNPVGIAVFAFGRYVKHVFASPGLVYLTDFLGLSVFDTSVPTQPHQIGFVSLSLPQALSVIGTYAYVLTEEPGGDQSLSVIDVANPSSPSLVATFALDLNGNMEDVHGVEGLAYVADGSAGLQIIDTSEPSKPTAVGSFHTGDEAWSIDVENTLACVANGTPGLRILDVSAPSSPIQVGQLDFPGEAVDVCMSGNFAYVALAGFHTGHGNPAGLQVVDISSPADSKSAGFLQMPTGLMRIDLSGDHVYSAACCTGFCVIDVSSPANPTEVGRVTMTGFAKDVHVAGEYAYVTWYSDFGDSLVIMDVSVPTRPKRLSAILTGDDPGSVFFSDGFAYIKYGRDYFGGLIVIDVRNPSRPTVVAKVLIEGMDIWGTIAVSNDFAYVADGSERLLVLDVSTPAIPKHVATVDANGAPSSVNIQAGHVYLPCRDGRVSIYEIR